MSDDKTPERLRLEAWVAEGKPCPGGCDGEPEFCHVDMLAFAASEVQRDREEAAKGAAPELAETEALFRKGTHYYGSHLIIATELDRLRATVARMKTALSLRGEQLAHEIEVREQRIAQVEATVARLQEELAETQKRHALECEARNKAEAKVARVGWMRPQVVAFAAVMECKLAENDHKPHWSGCDSGYLFWRLFEEARELRQAFERVYSVEEGRKVTAKIELAREAADVANFAMMIADNFGDIGRATGKAVDTAQRVERKTS